MDWVVQIGLIELALGGLLGWAMVAQLERPDLVKRIGIKAPRRILQVHLDYVLMGLILIGVGLAVPDLPDEFAVLLVVGTAVNPFLFVPPAFAPKVTERLPYRAVSVASFVCVTSGLIAAAVTGPG
jgi:hydroxylaminobenzene mutase